MFAAVNVPVILDGIYQQFVLQLGPLSVQFEADLTVVSTHMLHETVVELNSSCLKDTVPRGAVGVVVERRSLQTPISLLRKISVALLSVRRAVDGSERYVASDICWCTAK